MKRLFFLLAITFISITSFSQTFTNDRSKFVKELDKLMRQSTSEDLRGFINEELGMLLLESNEFPDDYFEKMITTSNMMIDKRLKGHPDVFNYVYIIYTIVKQKIPKESYEAWHISVDEMLDSRNIRRFKDFIDVSQAFFTEGVIALNPNYQWVYTGGKYNFTYEDKPIIHFEGGKLVCRTVNRGSSRNESPYTDSVVIEDSKGTYDLLRERWEGDGGKLTWEKVGLDKDSTYAKLGSYRLSMKSTNFTCDTVSLVSPYFDFEVKGSLTDRARRGSINTNVELPFPQFQSFERTFEIKQLIKDIDYFGGFSLQGANFVGEGTIKEPAQLTLYRNDKIFLKTASSQVIISDNKITSQNCATSLFIGLSDSIYHPGLNLNYYLKDETLQLVRGNSGISQSPFVNSLHKLDIYVEQITWKKSESELKLDFNFATSQQQRVARFESFDFYDERLFQQLQGMESLNPLTGLWGYAYKYDEYVFDEGTAASALKRTIQQAKSKLLDLSALGFISYDTENGIVTITQKLEHFVKSKSGKKDYDNISFKSDLTPTRLDGSEDAEQIGRIQKRNKERERMRAFGSIDLGTLELNIKAVDQVPISQSKSTVIFPEGNEVTLKENRSIHFTGWINSGKWEIQISDGNYNYKNNKFNIFKSEMALFRANPLKPEDGTKSIPIQSPFRDIKGELFVDDINNRSGTNKEFVNYPKLSSKEKCRITYEDRSIHRGAYDKERFYFEIDPFDLDSLATFDERYIRFDGELTSAGIFPKFREQLKVMPDYSLGFARQAPEGGYPFYGTDANYDNKIVLSNNGLQGSGQIDFINSSSISKAFTFLPDSTIGVAKFTNKPQETGVEFPDIEGPDAFITFIPRSNKLKARSNRQKLAFFGGDANLKGEATVKKDGITANGLMDLKGAYLNSKNFRFNRWQLDSDTANFNINNKYRENEQEDPLAFKTDNITAKVDFKERKGEFKSNDGTSTVEFPINKYICTMDMFTWLMDSDDIELESDEEDDVDIDSDLDLVGPNFFSIHPKQDSLQFRAPKATFNLKEKTIYCSKTEFIEIADARIFPDSAKVTIRKNAKMDPLENSKIVANYITKYHTIKNATTKITARQAYTSTGDYYYYDVDSNEYKIHLPKIYLNTSFQTEAQGEIKDDEDFQLSDKFDYYGEVFIEASNPNLTFKGATRINHNCDKFERNWMSFEAEIDRANIQIPVSNSMVDLDGNPISAGIVWRHSPDPDSIALYPAFLSALRASDDPKVITASGFLQFNSDAKEFQIASKEKLINRGEKGNYISLHTNSCSMNGDGVINLGMDYGDMEVDAVGVVNYNQDDNKTSMNLTLRVKTPMDQKIFENVGEKIAAAQELNDADFNSTTLEQAILEWVDRETADKIKSDFTLDRKYKKVPDAMKETFIITGLRLSSYKRFGDEQIGLKSSVDQAAIVNIYGEPVMKYVPLKFFAQQRTTTGDRLGMLIDVPAGYIYFFDYDNRKSGTMNILTSDKEFLNDIEDLKSDKKKSKNFMYQITKSSAYQSQFMRVFN